MKKLNKKMNKKMRKAADGGNLALIALAVGVIIIIGMYIFTKGMGSSTANKASQISGALDSTSAVTAPQAGNANP